MGIQNIRCAGSGLFLGTIFFLTGMMQKRANIMNDVYSKYFVDPTTKTNWNKIQTVFEPHIHKNLNPVGSTPSKPPRQIDGSFQPITPSKTGADYASMYDQADSLNLLLDSEAMAYHYDETIDPLQNIEATMKWDMLITSYVVLKNMDDVVSLIFEAIKPLYKGTSYVNLTPAQLWFHFDEFAHGSLFGTDSIKVVAWDTIDQYKTDNSSDLGIVDVILNYDFTELWYINIPSSDISPETETFHITESGFKLLSPPSGLPFGVTSTFVSDDPGGGAEATCSITSDQFNSKVIKYSFAPGDAGGGTITTTYSTITIS